MSLANVAYGTSYGWANPNKSTFIQGFTLMAEERQDLLAFLQSLTDQTFVNDPRFSDLGP